MSALFCKCMHLHWQIMHFGNDRWWCKIWILLFHIFYTHTKKHACSRFIQRNYSPHVSSHLSSDRRCRCQNSNETITVCAHSILFIQISFSSVPHPVLTYLALFSPSSLPPHNSPMSVKVRIMRGNISSAHAWRWMTLSMRAYGFAW